MAIDMKKLTTKDEVIDYLYNHPSWGYEAIRIFETRYGGKIFGIASLEDKYSTLAKLEEELDGKVLTSQLMSLPWHTAIYHALGERLMIRNRNDAIGDYDIFYDGEWHPWELKTTQGEKFQGSTHSSRKTPRTILLKYEVDRGMPIVDGEMPGLVVAIHLEAHEKLGDLSGWNGKPTKNNSRSTLGVHISDLAAYKSGITFGSVRACVKWCKHITQRLTKEEVYGKKAA